MGSISGCGDGAISDEELGEPVVDMADAPGADEPYDLNQLVPKEEESSPSEEPTTAGEGE